MHISGWETERVRRLGRACRTGRLWLAALTLVGTGCFPIRGSSSGYGPWLESLVGPLLVFDAEVVGSRTVELDMLGVDGSVVHVESYRMATVDDVTVVAEFAVDDFERGEMVRFESLTAGSAPLELVDVHDVDLEPGNRYRIYLWRFGTLSEPAYDFAVGFAWDLSADRPAERQSADGWQDDFDALRSAGLVDADMAGAEVLLEITRAFGASDPDARQRDIIVTLVGESMLPGTLPPVVDTAAP